MAQYKQEKTQGGVTERKVGPGGAEEASGASMLETAINVTLPNGSDFPVTSLLLHIDNFYPL